MSTIAVSKQEISSPVADLNAVTWRDLSTYSTPVRGSLTVVESGVDLPFSISRIFYIYGATKDCERGAHAHHATWQSFISIRGSFSLELTNGKQKQLLRMDKPDRVLTVPPMIWARLFNFTEDALCLVLASSLYDPDDYIREWDDYLTILNKDSK
jgi:WxcM-like, C-terminal